MPKKLSICIPTYNRSTMLIELLDSIVTNYGPEIVAQVEVCISDNASTDDTEARVKGYAESSPLAIRYGRNETNLGADQNFRNAVALAGGEFCWLMGSDDLVAPGLVEQVLQRLATGCSLLLMSRVVCDINMNPLYTQRWLDRGDEDHYFDFADRASLIEYLCQANSLGALFSYLSSIVVLRDAWNTVAFNKSYLGTAYAHVYVLMHVALRSGVLYAPGIGVLCRSGNDSFLVGGHVNRVLLDYRGYFKLANDLLPNDPQLKSAFLQVLSRERPFLHTSLFVVGRASVAEWQEAVGYFRGLGHSLLYLRLLRWAGPWVLSAYRRLRHGAATSAQ